MTPGTSRKMSSTPQKQPPASTATSVFCAPATAERVPLSCSFIALVFMPGAPSSPSGEVRIRQRIELSEHDRSERVHRLGHACRCRLGGRVDGPEGVTTLGQPAELVGQLGLVPIETRDDVLQAGGEPSIRTHFP